MNQPTQPVASSSALSSLRWWRMTQKELREILRDRRTIITLIGMPLLIYPLLGVAFQKLLVTQLANKAKVEYRLCFRSHQDSVIFRRVFNHGDQLIRGNGNGNANANSDHVPAGTSDDPVWVFLESKDTNATVDVKQLITEQIADIGVICHQSLPESSYEFELVYPSNSTYSLNARRAIDDRLKIAGDSILTTMMREREPNWKLPITIEHTSVSLPEGGGGTTQFSIATLIPLILILMTVTGAVYPAIDLTAGERERGTLEALISAPVPRHELLFAKYLAVLAVAMLTAIANLTSMTITAYSNGMEQLLFGSGGISARMLLLMFGLLAVFAGFFAAAILILTSFARSFKEAQAYLIPVMLVSLAPGVFCLLPGIEMTAWMSVTPLINIVILARDIVDGRAQAIWVVLTLTTTVMYSAVALAIAAQIFGTDAVLYGGEGSWEDLMRRPTTKKPTASISQAMFALAALLPTFLLLSGVPRRIAGDSVSILFLGNALITISLFALMPLELAHRTGVDLISGFRLHKARIGSYVAAALLGLCLWPIAIEFARMQSSSLVQSEEVKQLFERVSANLNAVPLWAKLLALAVIPAACEEFFFRGYLMTAFRTSVNDLLAILLSGSLFGLFHVISTLSFERFLPTFFLGLVLGWVCWQSKSVLPGMLLHVIHNSLILMMHAYQKELTKFGFGAENVDHVPASWLVGSILVAGIAVGIMVLSNRPKEHEVIV